MSGVDGQAAAMKRLGLSFVAAKSCEVLWPGKEELCNRCS
jgi:hypothetical protein